MLKRSLRISMACELCCVLHRMPGRDRRGGGGGDATANLGGGVPGIPLDAQGGWRGGVRGDAHHRPTPFLPP